MKSSTTEQKTLPDDVGAPVPHSERFTSKVCHIVAYALLEQARCAPVLCDLVPTAMGHFSNATGHFCHRPEGVDEFILIYCAAGSGRCELSNQPHVISPNQVLLIPPYTSHLYAASENDPWSIYYMHFAGDRAADYYSLLTCENGGDVLQLAAGNGLPEHFESTLRLLRSGATLRNLTGISLALSHLFGLCYRYRMPEPEQTAAHEPAIQHAIACMQESPDTQVSLPELAQQTGLSVSRYSTIFRQLTGQSPKAYLAQVRLQEACRLLLTTHLQIQEVSHAVGYDDPYYFSRWFKKNMGLSPLKYRQDRHEFPAATDTE